jgi:Transcriptional regulator PadR-like family
LTLLFKHPLGRTGGHPQTPVFHIRKTTQSGTRPTPPWLIGGVAPWGNASHIVRLADEPVDCGAAATYLALRFLAQPRPLTSEGTIYPLLTRLRKEQLVTMFWEESASGPPCRYYRLTDAGAAPASSGTGRAAH